MGGCRLPQEGGPVFEPRAGFLTVFMYLLVLLGKTERSGVLFKTVLSEAATACLFPWGTVQFESDVSTLLSETFAKQMKKGDVGTSKPKR